jgi:hypothetical protein
MAHYAKIENGIVTQVIVAEQEFINSGYVGEPTDWVQTSYNTHGNQHPEGRPLRGNYAGIGYVYDSTNDVFYAPQPYPSWTLNNTIWSWEAPVAMPTDGKIYVWDEDTTSWTEITKG